MRELQVAWQTCEVALADCPPDFTLRGAFLYLEAYIQVQLGDTDTAESLLARALHILSVTRNADMLVEARTVAALIGAYRGDLDAAYRQAVLASAPFEGRGLPRGVMPFAYATQARISLMRGDVVTARHALARLDACADAADALYQMGSRLISARIAAAEGDVAMGLSTCADVEVRAQAAGLGSVHLEALVLRATLEGRAGETAAACSSLHDALRLGEFQHAVAVFLGEGSDLASLLHEMAYARRSRSATTPYARMLLARLESASGAGFGGRGRSGGGCGEGGGASAGSRGAGGVRGARALRDPRDAGLTDRERDVLRLLNEGLSRKEIAQQLGVSLNTVKTHVNAIYAKLGVTNRSEAFEASRWLE